MSPAFSLTPLLWRIWCRALLEASATPGFLGESMHRKYLRVTKPRAQRAFEAALAALTPQDIALDLGPNLGEFTARLAATGAEVHAFEPDPSLARHLRQRFADTTNVHVHEAAVGAEEGRRRLHFTGSYDPLTFHGAASSTLFPGSRHTGASVEVQVIDLFDFLERFPRPPTILKMDIEGAEWPILERLIRSGAVQFRYLFAELRDKSEQRGLRRVSRSLRRRAAALNPGSTANLSWR